MSPGSSTCFSVTRSSPESLRLVIQCFSYIFSESSPLPEYYSDFRYGSYSRWVPPSAEREAPAPVPTPVPSPIPEAVPEEPQGFRRYQTRMGPRAPSPVPQRRVRSARPSKRAHTSGPGESSSSRPQPSPVTSAAEATSSPQLSPASRIRRSLFVGNPIPGNVRLHRRLFH